MALITFIFQLSLIRTRSTFFALTFHIVLPVRSKIEPFLHNLIRHNIPQAYNMILAAHQQYSAVAGAPGAAAAAVNIEQHQYNAPSPASAAVAAKQQQ